MRKTHTQINFAVSKYTTLFLISKEIEFKSHEITISLHLVPALRRRELLAGLVRVSSTKPILFLAERAMDADFLQSPLCEVLVVKKLRDQALGWMIS